MATVRRRPTNGPRPLHQARAAGTRSAWRRRSSSHALFHVSKTCVVRTGSVTTTFGEASLEDGGAGLVLRVRVDRELPVKRGDQMLIVDWDAERESFLVEPLDDDLRQIRDRR